MRTFAKLLGMALDRYVLQPRRLKSYEMRSEPFTYESPEGLLFRLHPGETVDRHIAVEGIYERRFLEFVKRVLEPGSIVIDVGANIGNHALFLRDTCETIHCFEPDPKALARLRSNLSLNDASNVQVHPCGLGAQSGIFPFRENITGNLGGSGFASHTRLGSDNYSVLHLPLECADEAIANLKLNRVDFIKIDVEGLESELIGALKDTIQRYRPLLAFEHHAQDFETGSFEEILASLPSYTIAELMYAPHGSSLLKRVIWHVRHSSEPTLCPIHRPEQRTYENLVAIPNEHPIASKLVDFHAPSKAMP